MVPPMTVKVYKDSIEDDLNEKVIRRSIDKSFNVANQFIEQLTKKELRSVCIQTNSIDELFAEHTYVIDHQRAALKAAKIRESSIMGELERIADLLKESREQQMVLKRIADAAELEKNSMLDSFDSRENQIQALLNQNNSKQEMIAKHLQRIKQLEDLLQKEKDAKLDLKA